MHIERRTDSQRMPLCCAGAGFARVYISEGGLLDSFAISASLFCIVMTSVLTGTVLPFGLAFVGVDPANAGTTIQVSRFINKLFGCIEPNSSIVARADFCTPEIVGHVCVVYVFISNTCILPAQVWCDVTGCLITCVTCKLILEQLANALPAGT